VRRNKKLFIPILLVIVVLIVMFAPFGPTVYIYRSVLNPSMLNPGEHVISSNRMDIDVTKKYVVYKDKLYLQFQMTRSTLVIITYVTNTQWNKKILS